MTCYFSGLNNRQVELLLSTIEEGAYRSRRDGCEVMLVRCAECSRMFEDEVGAFRERVIGRKAVLCLSCDPHSLGRACTGVTVQFMWYSE